MKLIDADAQYDRLADELKWLMQYGNDVYLAVAEAIRKEPTAYDINKVVRQLNLESAGSSIQMSLGLLRAIKIVKQGGRVGE